MEEEDANPTPTERVSAKSKTGGTIKLMRSNITGQMSYSLEKEPLRGVSPRHQQQPGKKPTPKQLKMVVPQGSLSLYDISFHHLLEDPDIDPKSFRKNYFTNTTGWPSHKRLTQTLRTNPRICLKKKSSKFGFYNQLTKAVKRKYRKYIEIGELKTLMPKILEISIRYFENLDDLKCSVCGKYLKVVREKDKDGVTTRTRIQYPLLNHGNLFYHEDCCPESIKSKLL